MENQKHGLIKLSFVRIIRFKADSVTSQEERKQQLKEEEFKSGICNIFLLIFFSVPPQHFGHFLACKKNKFLVFKGHINPPSLFFILENVSMNSSCSGD